MIEQYNFCKVNQFNFSLIDIEIKKIEIFLKNKNNDLELFNFSSKFGNHGIVGSFIIEKINNVLIKIFNAMSIIRIFIFFCKKIYDFENWDSLGNFNVLLACEKRFKIKI